MFIDADAPRPPRRRRISGVYSIDAHRKRRRQDALRASAAPAPEAEGSAESIARRRRNDAGRLAAALRQLGRGATALQVAEDSLNGLQSHLEALRRLAAPATHTDLSAGQRIAHGVRFSGIAKAAAELLENATFEGQALFGPTQPCLLLSLGKAELPLQLVDLSLVPRGLPALTLSSPIGAEAAAAVCATSLRRVDEGLLEVARLRHDVGRIVDGYRKAQQAIRRHSSLPPTPSAPPPEASWMPPKHTVRAAEDKVANEPSRAVRCQSSSDPDDVLHTLR